MTDPATPEQSQRFDIHRPAASHHLLSIINDILDLSKIEAGRVELEDLPFNLSTLLDNVASIVRQSAAAKGLAVEIDSDHVPLWLRGDATRLRQAMLNYAGNAVKFTSHGRIALRAQLLDEGAGMVQVRFEVEDTGVGIPADKLPLLFTEFEQIDASTTRRYGGTGLGLAITRRLARLMNGDAGASSQPGVGSTFWFTARLRRHDGPPPVDAATTVEEPSHDAAGLLRENHGGARILLVEDNEINRELALSWLEDLSFSVTVAVDGVEAIECARASSFDLVLMDMQMPNVDGLQATRAIRDLPGWQSTPILAMTANAFDDNRRLCEAAGMDDFITKPVKLDDLHMTLQHWLAARRR